MCFTIFQNKKTTFYVIKTISSKSRKIEIFPKGLTLGFGPKMAVFPTFCFQAIQAKKNVLYDILERNKAFLGYKNKKFKKWKNGIFPKWLTHCFGPEMAIFPPFSFQGIQTRKKCFTLFQNEKTPFQAIKTKSLKSRKIKIFPKGLTHGFGPKMAMFPTFCFQEIQARKMCFTIFQKKKKTFYVLKTRSSRSRKIAIFSKGLNHGFGPEMAIFPTFCFQAIQAKKVCFTIF